MSCYLSSFIECKLKRIARWIHQAILVAGNGHQREGEGLLQSQFVFITQERNLKLGLNGLVID